MPFAAPRLCTCGRVVPAGKRCECSIKRKAERDKLRPAAPQRGYDAEWRRLSKAYLAEPGNDVCADCGRPAVLVAHRVSIRKAPHLRLVRSNWKPSCIACNNRQNIACEGGFGRPIKQ
ncbi:HNH nuclease / phage PHI-105 holin-like protein [Nitrobacter hamburgensis X14]|jgi:5-methylcytosine-specific restriction endonuclease McrA|uniref:HNH nuclease / phage PHI-105 holin-like protein n=1 Tax=Nitrobacter hamburgensis (strain DSM 10229 / NCIMB 13809 / X14) TaxID=323097 RepID=Q1QRB6_NITHX|nr:HNH nuclease / phage PHI-105 holin-like protein [Nitrobacter hamburgensis X14]